MAEKTPRTDAFVVKVSDIVVGDRARKEFDLGDLMESIRKVGLIQPIVVEERDDGKVLLLAGECRLKSCILLGWSEIPCVLRKDAGELVRLEIELAENLYRGDLTWPEQVELLRRIDEVKREQEGNVPRGNVGSDEGFSLRKLAGMTGRSEASTSQDLKLAREMKERPDLAAQVIGLPKTAAMRRIEQLKEKERAERLVKGGVIEVVGDVKLGDARELICMLEKESVDLLLTDIPFGIPELKETRSSVKKPSTLVYKDSMRDLDNLTPEKVMELMHELIPKIFRVLKPSSHIYIFYAMELYEFLISELRIAGFIMEALPIIWYKGRVTAPWRGYAPQPCYETVLFGHKPPRSKRMEKAISYMQECKPVATGDKIHPFEKPEALLKLFIGLSSKHGDVVLDPFAGSGSTIIAAKDMGRSAVGFEADEVNYQRCQLRLTGMGR